LRGLRRYTRLGFAGASAAHGVPAILWLLVRLLPMILLPRQQIVDAAARLAAGGTVVGPAQQREE